MAIAPKLPPSRDQVVEAIETMGRHLDGKIDGVKGDLSAEIRGVRAEVAKLAEVTQANDIEPNRKLDRLLSKLGG